MSEPVGEQQGSADVPPATPVDEDSPPPVTKPPPSDSPPVGGKEPSPPSGGNNSTSPPVSSITTPPPNIASSSPPSSTSSTPPLPPLVSNSSLPSPPSNSGSSPPPPPPRSNSTVSSPPSQLASSPPPPPILSPSLLPPPPNSSVAHPPLAVPSQPTPPSGTPPKSNSSSPSPPPESPPAESLPTPTASNSPPPSATGSSGLPPPVQTFSPPLPETPPNANPSPQLPILPPATATPNPTPLTEGTPPAPSISSPAPLTPNHVPMKQSNSKSSESSQGGTVAGATVAGVLLIAFVAFFFVTTRRKKRRTQAVAAQYGPKPSNFSVKSDGYYHIQQHTVPGSSHSDGNYNGKPPNSPSAIGNSRGSYRGGAPESGVIGGTKLSFSYEELMAITNGFSWQSVIGEGGFGCVYKGCLSDGRVVAVKQLKAGSGQGEREFRAEVEIISRVHHRHLVSLVGYCIAEQHRLLVYEFVPNNNLEHHLHGKGQPVMEWSKRVKIAVGAARGLAYLHEDCHPKIIHRDIKSANILLDDAFEAQVADFGLAKLTNDAHTHVSTRVMGTFGYMAPEYASSGKLTDKSDVFSFGVVLLELVTGRKPVDPTQPLGDESLVEWARPLLIHAIDTGDFTELTDPKLEKRYVESEMFRMIETAAVCVRHSAPKRPRMVQVVRALDTEGDMPDLTNGVKLGQSTVYESGQYSLDIQRFQRMAFHNGDSSVYETSSGEYNS